MIDFITHNIVFTLLNTFFSIFIGFLITAYYSDNFHFPLVFKKHKILPSGHYNIIAHSRESKSVITWETEIKERFCRSSKITMRTIWADNFTPQTKEEKMWEYTGSIYKQGEYIIAHLNLKHYRVSDAEVNGKNVRRAYRGEDPCF